MNDELLITEDEYTQLTDELDYRKSVTRKEIAGRIKIALGFGDLSENAEYSEAKDEQNKNESTIIIIANKIKKAKVVKKNENLKDLIQMGSFVKIYDEEFDEELDYTVVGTIGADPFSGKISQESPLGKGLLGHKKGETITIESPSGDKIKYKILSVE